MKDIRSEVYNALADIMFETGASKEDMAQALEWFQIHFYEAEHYEEESK